MTIGGSTHTDDFSSFGKGVRLYGVQTITRNSERHNARQLQRLSDQLVTKSTAHGDSLFNDNSNDAIELPLFATFDGAVLIAESKRAWFGYETGTSSDGEDVRAKLAVTFHVLIGYRPDEVVDSVVVFVGVDVGGHDARKIEAEWWRLGATNE